MRELDGGKNTIGRMAAVLKKPHKATFNIFNLNRYSWQIVIKCTFSRQIFEKKNTSISSVRKSPPVKGQLYHAEGRTDRRTAMTNLTVVFSQFCYLA